MFRLICQRVLILGTLRPYLAGSLNVGLSQDLSFIGAEVNDRLLVGNSLSQKPGHCGENREQNRRSRPELRPSEPALHSLLRRWVEMTRSGTYAPM